MTRRLKDVAIAAIKGGLAAHAALSHLQGLRDQAMEKRCRKLLAELQKNCPDLLPDKPVAPGRTGPELDIDSKEVTSLVQAAMQPARGEDAFWRDGDNELLVHTNKVSLNFGDGVVIVSIPVSCDQATCEVQVPFAIGSSERLAGMIAATEHRPRGRPEIVDIWGEALIAFAWEALLRAVAALATASGKDLDGAGLIPIAIAASKDGLRLSTIARHTFDRVAPRIQSSRQRST